MRTLALYLLLTIALAARTAASTAIDPLAKPSTRIGPYYAVSLEVAVQGVDEVELCREFQLDSNGRIALIVGNQPLDKLSLSGLTAAEARERVRTAIARFYAGPPDVALSIARIPRIKVTVTGHTFRTGPVTLVEGSRLQDALSQTGYIPGADLSRIRIDRFTDTGQPMSLIVDFERAIQGHVDDMSNPVLQNADTISIGVLVLAAPTATYQVQGEVRFPGSFPYKQDMTVKDALNAAHGLLPSADPQSVTIIRSTGNLRSRIDAERAEAGIPTDDLGMEPGDLLLVERKDTGNAYAVVGEVVNPQTIPYRDKVTLKQALVECGGFKPDADVHNLVLSRAYLRDPAHPDTVRIDYQAIASGKNDDLELKPGDVVSVPAKVHRPSHSPLLDIGLFILRRFLLPL